MEAQTRIGPEEIVEAIDRIVTHILALEPSPEGVIVAGIANGGVPFGQLLAAKLSDAYGSTVDEGRLNITFHRDDLGKNPIPGEKFRTDFESSPNDAIVILADDVIFSGRSARAALAELFDLGRPKRVRLVTLFDRGGRMLPIQPDVRGFFQPIESDQRVTVELDLDQPDNNAITISPQ
ncbi:MAG: phosphoribosyltransferase family protein [Verrucomicrobiota bacterium]